MHKAEHPEAPHPTPDLVASPALEPYGLSHLPSSTMPPTNRKSNYQDAEALEALASVIWRPHLSRNIDHRLMTSHHM